MYLDFFYSSWGVMGETGLSAENYGALNSNKN